MQSLIKPLAIALTITFAQPATAECYADYKASRDNPLRLHYGVVELRDRDCGDTGTAERAVRDRLREAGWKLLNVLSVFGREGLDERRPGAGDFFLRY